MKKKFRIGSPSPYDVSNENFSKKSINPKVSRINSFSLTKARHHSLDVVSPNNFVDNKETLQV